MKVLVIPSAVLIPKEMRNRFGEIPTSLFPLNDRPMIDHIYDYYKDKVDRVVLVVGKKANLIKDYIDKKDMVIDIVHLDAIKDLGYTVLAGFQVGLSEKDTVYINFADTLLTQSSDMPSDNSCYYDQEPLNETWTFFQEANGCITDVLDKKEMPNRFDDRKQLPFFIGCFSIDHPKTFEQYLELFQNDSAANQECDSFYSALKKYSEQFPMNFKQIKEWFDVGHSEKYFQAKTGVKARSFNTISIDEDRGILKKTSENKEKFIHEIEWYLKLPSRLQYLIPRIYTYSVDRTAPFVEMECYGNNTLHEVLLYGDFPLYKWQNIFEKLRFIIKDMGAFTVKYSELCVQAIRDIYIKKTLDRLNTLKKQPQFHAFFERTIVINGVLYESLSFYMNILPQLVEKYLLEKPMEFSIIHGDLCFSNILLEENHGFVRIIDPRGEFGAFDLYGDPRYEMAKLLHSIEGKYDFIIEDLFTLNVNGTEITYKIPNRTDKILDVFYETFHMELKEDKAIRFIESLLFLSMIPLHSDYPKRQMAMLATGLELLSPLTEI